MTDDPKTTYLGPAVIRAIAREIAREELASLGGHLLATYGDRARDGSDIVLATLGGYLLEHYGNGNQT